MKKIEISTATLRPGSEGAASRLGELQSEVLGKLPQQANERLVYECKARN